MLNLNMKILAASTIQPINTSGRTKAQIVAEAEATWMLSHIVGLQEHDENCRCMVCWHRMADRVIRNTQEASDETAGSADMGIVDGSSDIYDYAYKS